uniref:Probable sulfite oxidase, mitochondrial n=1 Tax=Diabrotica virgifera virgifera TaxID=50390 RepID=A0A6P7GYK0_DIAVI
MIFFDTHHKFIVEKIIVSENESDSHWQQNDYKGFSPSVDWDTVDFTKSPAIQELPVISAICQPTANGAVKVEDGKITVKGYAWSGGGQKIVRVDVTIDGGKTWHVAKFDHQDKTPPPKHWSWTLWSIEIPVDANLKSV